MWSDGLWSLGTFLNSYGDCRDPTPLVLMWATGQGGRTWYLSLHWFLWISAVLLVPVKHIRVYLGVPPLQCQSFCRYLGARMTGFKVRPALGNVLVGLGEGLWISKGLFGQLRQCFAVGLPPCLVSMS